MQCMTCLNWYHINCTGLQAAQYSTLRDTSKTFTCVACVYKSNSFISPIGVTLDGPGQVDLDTEDKHVQLLIEQENKHVKLLTEQENKHAKLLT